jgi:hypothetical protein
LNCFDCQTTDRTATPAVANCRRCGAAVCGTHAHTASETVHRMSGVGVATLPRTARRITCETCYRAEARRL